MTAHVERYAGPGPYKRLCRIRIKPGVISHHIDPQERTYIVESWVARWLGIPMDEVFPGYTIGNDEWLTPPELVRSLGTFDLDPCSPVNRPWDTANVHYTREDDGLLLPWFGRVWMNPPYGRELPHWMNRIALHGNGIALVFARTETSAFQQFVFPFADSILFLKNRLTFHTIDGSMGKYNGGAPSVLIAYGAENSDALSECGIPGALIPINAVSVLVVAPGRSWRTIVEIVLVRLSQPSALEKIYDRVERIAGEKAIRNKHFKAKVRQVLQQHFKRIRRGVYTA